MGKILVIKGADFSAVAIGKVDPISGVSITTVAEPPAWGTTTGSGSYDEGSTIQISATGKSEVNGTFINWNDGDTNAIRNISVGSSPKTYIANFERHYGISDLVEGFYATADVVKIPTSITEHSDKTIKTICIEVSAGDIVTVSTFGGAGGRGYALADSARTIIERSDAEAYLLGSNAITLNVAQDGYLAVTCRTARLSADSDFYIHIKKH